MSMIERLETYANIKTNEPMSKHTTYHVGGNVDYYIYPDNFLSLMRVINILEEANIPFIQLVVDPISYLVINHFMVPLLI